MTTPENEQTYETSPYPCPRCDAEAGTPCTMRLSPRVGRPRTVLHTGRPRGPVVQPPPVPNDSTPIVDLVVADLAARKAHGIATYGMPLQAGNGRDMLRDAYEEAMDLAVYLRGAIEERDRHPSSSG